MNDLSARLRDVLSDETRLNALYAFAHALDQKPRGPINRAPENALQAWQDSIIAAVLPVWSSLLEDREREIREALRSLIFEARAVVNLEREGLIELVSLTNVRCLERRIDEADALLSRLASSSSPAAPQEQKEMRETAAVAASYLQKSIGQLPGVNAIGAGVFNGQDAIYVYVARRLMPSIIASIPGSWRDYPVVIEKADFKPGADREEPGQ